MSTVLPGSMSSGASLKKGAPNAALANSSVYTVTVRGGATDPRVKDAAGNAMAANDSWSFTTAGTADTTAPTVSARTPASGATAVAPGTNVTATFSEAVQANTASFTLKVGAGSPLFMIIPRFEIGSGFFLYRYITRKSRSGFTDTVRFAPGSG